MRFETPPIAEPSEPLTLHGGEHVVCSIKYYEYAIVEVQLEVGFEGDWEALVAQAARWMDAPDVEPEGRAVLAKHLQKINPAVIKPREEWLQEDFLVVDLHEIGGGGGPLFKAVAYGWRQAVVAEHAAKILDLGQDLHRRLGSFVGHLERTGYEVMP